MPPEVAYSVFGSHEVVYLRKICFLQVFGTPFLSLAIVDLGCTSVVGLPPSKTVLLDRDLPLPRPLTSQIFIPAQRNFHSDISSTVIPGQTMIQIVLMISKVLFFMFHVHNLFVPRRSLSANDDINN